MSERRAGGGERAARPSRRRAAVTGLALALAALLTLAGCARHSTRPSATPEGRGYVMGFSGIGPRADLAAILAAIQMWSARSDAAIMSGELPWDSLLAGVRPDSLVIRQQRELAQYYRALGLHLTVMIDPANGLDRGAEAPALVAAGRSVTEPAVRDLYRRYVVAVDTLLRPDELGLALETNLIRLAAPESLYAAIVQMTSDAAAAVRAHDATVKLLVSVQVETAWGRLGGGGAYVGVARDFADFPFVQVLGLSSYPYLGGWAQPEDLPDDYYSRLAAGHALAVIVTEGGWSSRTIAGGVPSSPALQRRYLVRQARLLDVAGATAWYQLTFTDLDLTSYPMALAPFAYLGLVDSALAAKPALAPWDSVFARPRR